VVNETEHAETVPHAFCGVNAPRVEVLVPEILEMSEDYRHVATRCPQCNYKMNAATNVHGGDLIPQKGYERCINCGQVLKYEADLTLRKAGNSRADAGRNSLGGDRESAAIHSAERKVCVSASDTPAALFLLACCPGRKKHHLIWFTQNREVGCFWFCIFCLRCWAPDGSELDNSPRTLKRIT
jgi:hypothetical protein